MLRQLWAWLGPVRAWGLALLLGVVIASSIAVQFALDSADARLSAQLGLVGLFVAALGLALSGRVTPPARRRLWIALGPGLALLALGVLLPPLALFFGGAGLGWMVMGQFVLRSRVRMEYQAAVKHMRKGAYLDAVAVMDDLIRAEPNTAEHYRFRAELYRLAGKPQKAIKDYRRVTQLEPDALTGYTGLAEIAAQQGDYVQARTYAQQAAERESQSWMPLYNLGMIADRQADAAAAVRYLEQARARGVDHSRYRMMLALWLARNYLRLDRSDDAAREAECLRKETSGLREWELVMQSAEAAPLRELLAEDVALARKMVEAAAPLAVLEAQHE